MRALRTILTGAVLAAAVVVTAVPAAQAADTASPRPGFGAQADGRLYAWTDIDTGGTQCSWPSNSGNWGTCWNTASSLWMNRYPGTNDDVWVYWGLNCTKARRGVQNGVYLNNLTQWTFDAGSGQGAGEWLNDNIASHCFANIW